MNRLLLIARFDQQFRSIKLGRWVLRVLLLLFLILALLGLDPQIQRIFFALFFVTLPLGILTDLFGLFLRSVKDEEEKKQIAMVPPGGMTYEVARVLTLGMNDERKTWFQLTQAPSIVFLLVRLGLNPHEVYKLVTQLPQLNDWQGQANQMAQAEQRILSSFDLFTVIARQPQLQSLWNSLGVTDQDRTAVNSWYLRLEKQRQLFSRPFQRFFSQSLGRDWTSGYTQSLDEFGLDLTYEMKRLPVPLSLVGHSAELNKILETMDSANRRPVLLVGEEGIGKTRLLYRFATLISQGLGPKQLVSKRVYMLDVGKLISNPNQEVESLLRRVFTEAIDVGNVILIIPDIHLLLSQQSEVLGTVNALPIISEYLATGLPLLATTTPADYFRLIKPQPALESTFSVVQINEIKGEEALQILQDELYRYEGKQIYTYPSLTKIVALADQYIHDVPFPEKALQLLQEVADGITHDENRFVLSSTVERIVSNRLKIPLGQASSTERELLQNLESAIQSRIVGQTDAVRAVADALRRARAGLHSGKRPIGSFLFLGPTGVGKTEMAKTIAALYFRNEKAFIRIDMSEYQTTDSTEKLIGSQNATGVLTTAISDQPYSVILLDEIEKATPAIRNLFLQILDDGYITNGFGQKVDFTNSMIIATSNAGSELIRQTIQQQATLPPTFRSQLLDYLQSNAIFAAEWLNRFDAIITFLPLTVTEIRQVAHLMVAELIDRLKTHNIDLTVDEDVYDLLVERGYDPQFGARPMRRAVQDSIESVLAKQLLNDTNPGMKKIVMTKTLLTS